VSGRFWVFPSLMSEIMNPRGFTFKGFGGGACLSGAAPLALYSSASSQRKGKR